MAYPQIKITNSSYLTSVSLYKHIEALGHYIQGKVLDVGCGNKPYKTLFDATEYIGMDFKGAHDHTNENIDIFYDGKTFPIDNNSFDAAVCTQVLEHVEDPILLLSEINRVIKLNGRLLISAPFIWGEHEIPYDFRRFSSFGMTYYLEKSGFKIIEYKKSVSDIRAISQLINSYLVSIPSKNKKNKPLQLIISLLIAWTNIIGMFFHYILPKRQFLYLDNVIIAEKIKNLL